MKKYPDGAKRPRLMDRLARRWMAERLQEDAASFSPATSGLPTIADIHTSKHIIGCVAIVALLTLGVTRDGDVFIPAILLSVLWLFLHWRFRIPLRRFDDDLIWFLELTETRLSDVVQCLENPQHWERWEKSVQAGLIGLHVKAKRRTLSLSDKQAGVAVAMQRIAEAKAAMHRLGFRIEEDAYYEELANKTVWGEAMT